MLAGHLTAASNVSFGVHSKMCKSCDPDVETSVHMMFGLAAYAMFILAGYLLVFYNLLGKTPLGQSSKMIFLLTMSTGSGFVFTIAEFFSSLIELKSLTVGDNY